MSAFRVIADGKWIVFDDGDTWPTPMDGNSDDGGLEWRLRYMNAEQVWKDRMLAASVVNAYRALILTTDKNRRRIIAGLRKAMRTRLKATGR
mgnify:CR=1 FL=1